jgi:hypothetical protein
MVPVSTTYILLCLKIFLPIPATARSAAARLLGYGLESRQEHGCLSLVSVVCCQVQVPATD